MSFVTLVKGLMALWPFVKEMFFAGKSFKDVVLAHKMVVFLLFLLALSLAVNYLSLGKIYDIAVARREEHGQTGGLAVPVKAPQPAASAPPDAASMPYHYERASKLLDEIYQEQHP